jgi:hypothetical protein
MRPAPRARSNVIRATPRRFAADALQPLCHIGERMESMGAS